MRRVDSILDTRGFSQVRLVKVDVEGFELEVLLGLGSRLRDCANVIVEQLDDSPALRRTQVVELLADAGFALRAVEGRPWQEGRPLAESSLRARRSSTSEDR